MNEEPFEGSLVLEKLNELDLLDEFYEVIDNEDLTAAKRLLRRADLDDETIQIVLEKMQDSTV